jgi:hypothetical protein
MMIETGVQANPPRTRDQQFGWEHAVAFLRCPVNMARPRIGKSQSSQ